MYRLRADTVYGYDRDDWLHTPLVAPDARFDLTTEQIEETLKYFCKFGESQRQCPDSIQYNCIADLMKHAGTFAVISGNVVKP